MRLASLEIHKEELSFSAGHFTIFSAEEREQLHGHNYYVSVAFKKVIQDNGLSFDYRIYKKKLLALCDQLDRHFLLPSQSEYLQLKDVLYQNLLPLANNLPMLFSNQFFLPHTIS